MKYGNLLKSVEFQKMLQHGQTGVTKDKEDNEIEFVEVCLVYVWNSNIMIGLTYLRYLPQSMTKKGYCLLRTYKKRLEYFVVCRNLAGMKLRFLINLILIIPSMVSLDIVKLR